MTQNVNVVMDRGSLHEIKKGDDAPMELSFSVKLEGLESPTAVTLYEALTLSGAASAWVTTRSGTNVDTVDVIFTLLDKTGSSEEVLTFPDFWFEKMDIKEGDTTGMVSVSGKSFATLPTIA